MRDYDLVPAMRENFGARAKRWPLKSYVAILVLWTPGRKQQKLPCNCDPNKSLNTKQDLERANGIEPSTPILASGCSPEGPLAVRRDGMVQRPELGAKRKYPLGVESNQPVWRAYLLQLFRF